MEVRGLPEGQRRNEGGPGTNGRAYGGISPGQPGQFLPLRRKTQDRATRIGSGRCDAADRAGMAELRTAAHHSGVIPARLGGELEARLPVDARRYLLCVRKRKFMITTYSSHGRRIWPNLAGGMVLSDVDQLWRADITYTASPATHHSALKSSCRSILFHRTVNSVLTVCLSFGDHPLRLCQIRAMDFPNC